MSTRIVAMAALPRGIPRFGVLRKDLSYLPYAQATWEWWCRSRGVEFTVLREAGSMLRLPEAPATIHRWYGLAELLHRHGPEARVALVDADTMIHPETPDFFAVPTGDILAVPGRNHAWIRQSIAAYQPLFPGVDLTPEHYFNAGFVVMGTRQLPLLSRFGSFCEENYPQLAEIFNAGSAGTDQTPLNFIIRREGEPVSLLDRRFNMLHCFGYPPEARRYFELTPEPDWSSFRERVLLAPGAFDFLQAGYIWHFTNAVAARTRIMAETWRRLRPLYPEGYGPPVAD